MILWRNIEKKSIFIILIPTPDFPHFYYVLDGNRGSLLYGDVSVMECYKTKVFALLVDCNFSNFEFSLIVIWYIRVKLYSIL